MRNALRQSIPLAVLALFLALASFSAPALDAQHVSEITPKSFEDLPAFLRRFPHSFEAWLFYGLYGSAFAGAVSSWLWKWTQGQADGFKHWSAKYAVQQLMWFGAQAVTAIMTVGFVTDAGEFYGWLAVLYTGAVTGFGGEVKLAWTAAQRAAQSGGVGGGA